MVTVLNPDTGWADAFRDFGGGLVKGYTEGADERALQKAVSDLPPNASARDVLNAITNTNTYDNKAKQQVLGNYMGVQNLEAVQRKGQAKEEEIRKKNELLESTNALKNDLKVIEDQKKAQKDINDALSLIDSSALEHDEKDTLREKIKKGETSFDAVKEIMKQKKGQEKTKQEEKSLQTTQKAFNDLAKLIPDVGVSNIIQSNLGGKTSGKYAEFTALTGALEALLVEKVNRGALSNTRFKYITETLLPKPSDSQEAIRGKLKGLATNLDLDPSALGVKGEEIEKDKKGRRPLSAFEVKE